MLWATCGIGVLVVLGDWLVSIAQVRLSGRTGERLLYSLRLKTFAQLQRLGMDYYERELTGRIMTRMTTDVDALSSFLQTGLTTTVVSLLQFAGVLIVLLVLDPALAGIVLSVMPVLAVATVLFRRKSSAAYTDAREKVSAVNASLQENMSGVRVTQAFNQQHGSTAEFRRVSDDYRQSRMKAQQYIATYFPFVEFLSEITAALVLSFGAASVHSGHLTTGTLIAFLLYLDLFFSPVQQLSQVFDGYQQALVGLHRLSDLLRTPTTVPPAPQPLFVDRMRGEVTFSDVYFRYASRSGPDGETRGVDALSGVTVRIEPGETVALVGQTGAGKSTMVKLVARFYDPTAGVVRADGKDLRDLDLATYRHRLGFVPQEAYLFRGTVRDAIAYGKPDATDAEVEAAARMVGRARDRRRVLRRLPARRRRAGPRVVRRPAPASRARPGRAGRPGHPAAGRGDGVARPRDRGRRAECDGAPGTSPYDTRHRAPADHRRTRRPGRRRLGRPGGRGRDARSVARRGRRVRGSMVVVRGRRCVGCPVTFRRRRYARGERGTFGDMIRTAVIFGVLIVAVVALLPKGHHAKDPAQAIDYSGELQIVRNRAPFAGCCPGGSGQHVDADARDDRGAAERVDRDDVRPRLLRFGAERVREPRTVRRARLDHEATRREGASDRISAGHGRHAGRQLRHLDRFGWTPRTHRARSVRRRS